MYIMFVNFLITTIIYSKALVFFNQILKKYLDSIPILFIICYSVVQPSSAVNSLRKCKKCFACLEACAAPRL